MSRTENMSYLSLELVKIQQESLLLYMNKAIHCKAVICGSECLYGKKTVNKSHDSLLTSNM